MENDRHTEPNAGTADPTDGRKKYEWVTGYPPQAWVQIKWELFYLTLVFLSSLFVIYATRERWICSLLSANPGFDYTLNKYVYYAASGMLGGVVFDIKYFYRAVGRGYWHQDRIIWRLMSPLIALAVAFIVGVMIDACLLTSAQKPTSAAAIVSIGFLAGYFADEAVGKMYEIAIVIFGKSGAKKAGDGK